MSDTRHIILEQLLPAIPFDGWTERSLQQAASDAGVNAIELARAFPGGIRQCIDMFVDDATRKGLEVFRLMKPENMKIRERIAAAVSCILQEQLPHREAVRRAVAFHALPWNIPHGLQALYRTVDDVWHACGDTATDFNFYSKRLLLASVYSSTLLFWLEDKSHEQQATKEFLGRRINNVMQMQKLKGKLAAFSFQMPKKH